MTAIIEKGGAVVITVEGKLVLGNPVNEFREIVSEAVLKSSGAVIADLSKVTYIDSAGLGALAVGAFKAKNAGRTFRVAAPQKQVRQAIGITRIDLVIPIFASVAEALAADNAQPSI